MHSLMEMLNKRLSKILLTESANKYLEVIASWDIETSKIEYKDETHALCIYGKCIYGECR